MVKCRELPDCPTPFKLRFVSRWEARKAAVEIAERKLEQRLTRKGKGKRVTRRTPAIYECSCRGYHLVTRRGMLTQR